MFYKMFRYSLVARFFFLNIRYLHASQRALRFAIFIYPRLLYREMFHYSGNHIIDLSNCVLKAVLFILYTHISGYMYHWRNF